MYVCIYQGIHVLCNGANLNYVSSILYIAVFTIGAVVMGAAQYPWMLLIGRIIVGFGIGIAAMAVPMYIAELAPAEMRGRLVVVNNMFITGGQFVATVIDGAFSYLGINVGWRSVAHMYTNILGKHPCRAKITD